MSILRAKLSYISLVAIRSLHPSVHQRSPSNLTFSSLYGTLRSIIQLLEIFIANRVGKAMKEGQKGGRAEIS